MTPGVRGNQSGELQGAASVFRGRLPLASLQRGAARGRSALRRGACAHPQPRAPRFVRGTSTLPLASGRVIGAPAAGLTSLLAPHGDPEHRSQEHQEHSSRAAAAHVAFAAAPCAPREGRSRPRSLTGTARVCSSQLDPGLVRGPFGHTPAGLPRPCPTRDLPQRRPLRPGLSSRGSPALPEFFLGVPPQGGLSCLVEEIGCLSGGTLTQHSSRDEQLHIQCPIGRKVERQGPGKSEFLLSLALGGGFQESICPVDPFLPVGAVQSWPVPSVTEILAGHSPFLRDPIPCLCLIWTLSKLVVF